MEWMIKWIKLGAWDVRNWGQKILPKVGGNHYGIFLGTGAGVGRGTVMRHIVVGFCSGSYSDFPQSESKLKSKLSGSRSRR